MTFEIFNSAEVPKKRVDARKIAIENGWKYYNGTKCRRGHSGQRLTKDGQCVECRSILRKKHYNPERMRNWELKKLFGITLDDYKKLSEQQNHVCKICKNPEKNNKRLAVDHCHDTGKIRGLLCFTCNMGIGYLKHNPELIKIAALYCE